MNKRGKNQGFFQSAFFTKNRRGQIYLIAAIMIIAVLISFATISNYSSSKIPAGISNLRDGLKIEGDKMLDYSAINGYFLMNNFTKDYATYSGEDIKIIYITGEKSSMEVYKYEEGLKVPVTFTRTGDDLKVIAEDIEYDFKLNAGNNFHFIMSQQVGGEQFIVTSQDD